MEHEKRFDRMKSLLEKQQKAPRFAELTDQLLQKRGVHSLCDVNVKKKDVWYEFKGKVDSPQTKSALFGAVPKVRGRQHIVDKLRVAAPRTRSA